MLPLRAEGRVIAGKVAPALLRSANALLDWARPSARQASGPACERAAIGNQRGGHQNADQPVMDGPPEPFPLGHSQGQRLSGYGSALAHDNPPDAVRGGMLAASVWIRLDVQSFVLGTGPSGSPIKTNCPKNCSEI